MRHSDFPFSSCRDRWNVSSGNKLPFYSIVTNGNLLEELSLFSPSRPRTLRWRDGGGICNGQNYDFFARLWHLASLTNHEITGSSLVVEFWSTPWSRHVSHLIKTRQQSIFPRHFSAVPVVAPPSGDSTAPRTLRTREPSQAPFSHSFWGQHHTEVDSFCSKQDSCSNRPR